MDKQGPLLEGIFGNCFAGTAAAEDKLSRRFLEMEPKAAARCRAKSGSCSILIKKKGLRVYGTNE